MPVAEKPENGCGMVDLAGPARADGRIRHRQGGISLSCTCHPARLCRVASNQ